MLEALAKALILLGRVFRFRDRTVAFLEPTTRRVGGISEARQLNQRRHSDHIPLGRVVLFSCPSAD